MVKSKYNNIYWQYQYIGVGNVIKMLIFVDELKGLSYSACMQEAGLHYWYHQVGWHWTIFNVFSK